MLQTGQGVAVLVSIRYPGVIIVYY